MLKSTFKIFLLHVLLIICTIRLVYGENEEDEPDESKAETLTLTTKLGSLRGRKEVVTSNLVYYAFKGIRYAKPPVRFQPPEAMNSWQGTKSALRDGDLCPQFNIASNAPIGKEDCLTLNVYTRSVNGSKPVIVYLHNGAFLMGGGVSYYFGPKLLLEQDVVLVTIQYRLGPFGFLSTGDSRASGNFGLLDQLMALRWIQTNIGAFGGDPHSVTLMGEDAGAASATMLTLSPLAEGLFHRVIALSGNVLCTQYMQTKPIEATMELASRLECPNLSVEEGLECLRSKPVEDIILRSNDMHIFYSFPRWFSPVVDGVVLLQNPEKILNEGSFHHVPTIVGHTKEEGAFFYRLILNTLNNGRYDDTFFEKFIEILPVMTEWNRKLYPVSQAIHRRYFRNVDLDQENQFRPKYVELLTDILFTRCTEKYSRLLANNGVPTYRYLFEYRGQYSIVNLQGEEADLGVAHGDDLQYVFNDIWGSEHPMSDEDLIFSKELFLPLLVNFAKYSTPTPHISSNTTAWTPFSKSKARLLRIGSKLSVELDYRIDYTNFWNEEVPSLLRSSGTSRKGADQVTHTSKYLHRQEL